MIMKGKCRHSKGGCPVSNSVTIVPKVPIIKKDTVILPMPSI